MSAITFVGVVTSIVVAFFTGGILGYVRCDHEWRRLCQDEHDRRPSQ